MIMERGLKKDVVLVPGKAFMPIPDRPCSYMRAAFSLASDEQMERVSITNHILSQFYKSPRL